MCIDKFRKFLTFKESLILETFYINSSQIKIPDSSSS